MFKTGQWVPFVACIIFTTHTQGSTLIHGTAILLQQLQSGRHRMMATEGRFGAARLQREFT